MDNQDKPATAAEIEAIQKQLSQICNDPDMAMLECHCIDLKGLEDGTIRSAEEWKEVCKKCPAYIEFAAKYPKHIPDYSE